MIDEQYGILVVLCLVFRLSLIYISLHNILLLKHVIYIYCFYVYVVANHIFTKKQIISLTTICTIVPALNIQTCHSDPVLHRIDKTYHTWYTTNTSAVCCLCRLVTICILSSTVFVFVPSLPHHEVRSSSDVMIALVATSETPKLPMVYSIESVEYYIAQYVNVSLNLKSTYHPPDWFITTRWEHRFQPVTSRSGKK